MSYEDDIDDDSGEPGLMVHSLCGSIAEHIGDLGNMASYRCRGCGMVFQHRNFPDIDDGWLGSDWMDAE